jgi:site-specific recombinase XerD
MNGTLKNALQGGNQGEFEEDGSGGYLGLRETGELTLKGRQGRRVARVTLSPLGEGYVSQVFLSPFLFRETPAAPKRILEFFATQIRNPNTRAAYVFACEKFLNWCEFHFVTLEKLEPTHVAAYVETMKGSIPTIKQHTAAIRQLLDYLTTKGILEYNPALSVKTPRHSVTKGKTPVMESEDVRKLLESLPVDSVVGLRDRAIIGTMVYTFARVGAVVKMNVGDFYSTGRRSFLRLKEKGGKDHEVPVHLKLEEYLDCYLAATGISEQKKVPLFQSARGRTDELTGDPLLRENVMHMVKRRCRQAGIGEIFGCHTFRATGITAYLNAGGTLEKAQQIAAHASASTTKLYDRTNDAVSLEEIQRIRF